MTKEERAHNGVKTVSLANGVGKTGQIQAPKGETRPLYYTMHKNKLGME